MEKQLLYLVIRIMEQDGSIRTEHMLSSIGITVKSQVPAVIVEGFFHCVEFSLVVDPHVSIMTKISFIV